MLASLDADPALVVIVTGPFDPIKSRDIADVAHHLLTFENPGMLFGEWFNLGFDYLASDSPGPYEVLCIGSSMLADPTTIPTLRDALRGHSLTMVGPDLQGLVPAGVVEQHRHDTRTLYNRVPAQCFMMPGELGLRFDPDFRWWYSDDQLEMEARKLGPVGLVGGMNVRMTHPDGHYLTEQQAIWATEDRAKFVTKYGHEPW